MSIQKYNKILTQYIPALQSQVCYPPQDVQWHTPLNPKFSYITLH